MRVVKLALSLTPLIKWYLSLNDQHTRPSNMTHSTDTNVAIFGKDIVARVQAVLQFV